MTNIVNRKITFPIYENVSDVHFGDDVTIINKDGVMYVDKAAEGEPVLGRVVKLFTEVEFR
jgi:predicted transcriptional regulator